MINTSIFNDRPDIMDPKLYECGVKIHIQFICRSIEESTDNKCPRKNLRVSRRSLRFVPHRTRFCGLVLGFEVLNMSDSRSQDTQMRYVIDVILGKVQVLQSKQWKWDKILRWHIYHLNYKLTYKIGPKSKIIHRAEISKGPYWPRQNLKLTSWEHPK